jgi:TRAP-type C4-dicarboxylate transport system, large permease component
MVPGFLVGVVILVLIHYFAVPHNCERSDEPSSVRRAGREYYRSPSALRIPEVKVGSVGGGVASVVEAGAITAGVAL